MCEHRPSNGIFTYLVGIGAGIAAGYLQNDYLFALANFIATGFVSVFKWISIPLILLAILSTSSKLENKKQLFSISLRVLKYTLLTTFLSSLIALLLFIVIQPKYVNLYNLSINEQSGSKVFGILLILSVISAILVSIVIVSIKSNNTKNKVSFLINMLYSRIMRLVNLLLKFIPVAIFSFVCLFIQEIDSLTIKNLSLYLLCILLANLIQAIIVLPSLLTVKGLPVINCFKNMFPALSLAFWSKSSSVALPVATQCAVKHGISDRVAKFCLPLCTTINMNACAAFILITVLFVATSNGMHFSYLQLIGWSLIAVVAAIGNAGVPMGCYTISSAIIAYLNLPMYLLGLILPFYALIDMLESAINVWSDACVTSMVDRDLNHSPQKLVYNL